MDVGVGPALLLQILELRVHHGAALFYLPLDENKNEQRNAGITTSVRLIGNLEICSFILRRKLALAVHRPQHWQIKRHDETYEQRV
jgi:hypothetical protein